MATVRIPSQLRNLTDGVREMDIDGSTVRELIDGLESKHPGLKEKLIDKEAKLSAYINVYVNSEEVRHLNGLDTKVEDGAEVSMVFAITGG